MSAKIYFLAKLKRKIKIFVNKILFFYSKLLGNGLKQKLYNVSNDASIKHFKVSVGHCGQFLIVGN